MFKKTRDVKRIIERYRQELKNFNINSQKIILYGSYAKGNPREDSDIDLIIISDDFKDMNLRERLEILGIAAGRVFEPIEALGYTSKEIKQKKEEGVLSLESISEGEQREEALLEKFTDQDPRVKIIRASQQLIRTIVESPERF